MTDAIAQREFSFANAAGQVTVVATIRRPAAMPDSAHGDWYCPWRIEGPDRTRELFGTGVDALQALLGAISMARCELECIAERGSLSWLGQSGLGVGLSIAPEIPVVMVARLKVLDVFEITDRGRVVAGEILDGTIRIGMFALLQGTPVAHAWRIAGIEFIDHVSAHSSHVALVLPDAPAMGALRALLPPGSVLKIANTSKT